MNKLLLLFPALAFFLLSMSSPWTYIPKEKLLADIDSIYVYVDEIHPQMFAYISKQEFDKHLAETKAMVTDSMTALDFFNLISPLVAKLADGHTSVYFPYKQINTEEVRLFPFSIEIDIKDTTAIVLNDHSDPATKIPIGAKIVSVNGKSMTELTGIMLGMISGEADHFKAARLNDHFSALHYSLFRENNFDIIYFHENEEKQLLVEGLKFSQRFGRGKLNPEPFRFTVDEESNIAIIQFNLFIEPEKFAVFLDSSFTVIQNLGIEDLIIDVRTNPGGSSLVGDQLFQYISAVPFRQFGPGARRMSERILNFYNNNYKWKVEEEPGIYHWKAAELIELVDNPLRFEGNCYLLTSNFTFSSAASFSWAFSYFGMGTVIGRETGGLGVCFGDVIPLVLPGSQLQIGISHKKFYHYGADDESIHGTIPHYDVPSREAMDFAKRLILERR
jgi:hypothetical protein